MSKAPIHGVELCYRDKNRVDDPNRLPVILVHGAAGGTHVWFHQLGTLARTRRVVAPDLPAHGCSKQRPSEPVTISLYATMVCELADNLGITQALFVGHSMGGAVALQAALDRPELVAGLVIGACGPRLPVSPVVFDVVENHYDQFGGLVSQFAFGPKADPDLVKLYTEPPLVAAQAVVADDFRACAAFDITAKLTEITQPTLVLHGSEDKMVSRKLIDALVSGLPDSRFQELSGFGHMIFQEAPEQTTTIIEDFAQEVETRLGREGVR